MACDVEVTDHADKQTPAHLAMLCWGATCEVHGDLLNGDWFDRVTVEHAAQEHLEQSR